MIDKREVEEIVLSQIPTKDRSCGWPAFWRTIGYGHTGSDVVAGLTISPERANALLWHDIAWASEWVNSYAKHLLNQSQFDALVDFTFNLGLSSLASSTLLKKIKAGDYTGAAAEFPKWNKVRVNGVLQVSPGLTRRRLAEQAMFEGRDWREL